MTERKVINKYFPPDYDPTKIPRLRRGDRSRQFNIRTMAPFNMRCTTCNGYIYKAKKFNSRMETAENVEYLGLRHYRFYIRCPSCCAEIIWRTDLENGDYVLESGAKRNFEALKTAEELEAKRQAEEEEEIASNPMKLLEQRTDQSKQEMDMVEVIEDLKQLNQRQAGMEADHLLLRHLWKESEAQQKADKESDEAQIKELLALRSKQPPECVDEVVRVINPEEVPSTLSDTPVLDSVANPSLIPNQRRFNKPPQKQQSVSYMKRHLQGAVLIGKKVEHKLPGLDSSCSSSLPHSAPLAGIKRLSEDSVLDGDRAPKSAKLTRIESTTGSTSSTMSPVNNHLEAVLIGKRVEHKPPGLDSSCSSSLPHSAPLAGIKRLSEDSVLDGDRAPKSAKLTRTESTTGGTSSTMSPVNNHLESAFPLPGMTYSDHSDSD